MSHVFKPTQEAKRYLQLPPCACLPRLGSKLLSKILDQGFCFFKVCRS